MSAELVIDALAHQGKTLQRKHFRSSEAETFAPLARRCISSCSRHTIAVFTHRMTSAPHFSSVTACCFCREALFSMHREMDAAHSQPFAQCFFLCSVRWATPNVGKRSTCG